MKEYPALKFEGYTLLVRKEIPLIGEEIHTIRPNLEFMNY